VKILTIVGARPQFIKAAAVGRAVAAHNAAGGPQVDERIVHTGQHYDENMSAAFFEQLGLPEPAVNLGVGSGSHAQQTALMIERLEPVLLGERPDVALVYGDTNSTLAGALVAAKLNIPIAHVEAGLRSFNRRMPEEINRCITDRLSDILFCPTEAAAANLAAEGVSRGVHRVGDVMYDSVLHFAEVAERSSRILEAMGLAPGGYGLATVHRAENTDDPARLAGVLEALSAAPVPIIFPLHPRTRKMLGAGIEKVGGRVRIVEPAPYLDMLRLERHARVILTDSGGVQKEAFWFGVPCVTLRGETEWVELAESGWNRVAGTDPAAIRAALDWAESMDRSMPRPGFYGEGNAASRVVSVLARRSGGGTSGGG